MLFEEDEALKEKCRKLFKEDEDLVDKDFIAKVKGDNAFADKDFTTKVEAEEALRDKVGDKIDRVVFE